MLGSGLIGPGRVLCDFGWVKCISGLQLLACPPHLAVSPALTYEQAGTSQLFLRVLWDRLAPL